jgi:hypothetical protein
MTDLNFALYYPSMEFRNVAWLKGMLLFWDGIRRIVPESYTPNDVDEVKPFLEAEIIKSIDPRQDAAKIADEFRNKLEGKRYTAAALSYMERSEDHELYYRIHPDKVDSRLRDLLSAKEISKATKDWLYVSEEFGRYYMLYLANSIAESRGLAKIIDSTEAWAASTYFDYEGEIDVDTPFEESDQAIITLMLRDFVPANIQAIPAKSVLLFREKYRDERRRFLESIKTYITKISNINDPQTIQDVVNEYKKDVEASIKDFKESLRSLKFTSLTGIKAIAFPLSTNVVHWLGICTYEDQVITTAVAGLALGLLTSYREYKEKRKTLIKECDYSYIYFLENILGNWQYKRGPLNYHLYRQIEEFIND